MKYVLIAIALTMTACGTIQEQTLEYCDTTTKTIIGVPYSRDADCQGVSNSETGTGVVAPIQLPE